MPDVLYAPVLKGRMGELAALGQIQPVTRQHILPLLEIVPASVDDAHGAPQLRTTIEKIAAKLRIWASQRLLLDAGLLATEVKLRDGFGSVGFSIGAAIDQAVDVPKFRELPKKFRALKDEHQNLHRSAVWLLFDASLKS